MNPPPPAEPFASRIFLGPALRTQPDKRLVKLVREGYEAAFEEIVRRYRKPLDRFAAAFVGGRSEDVTQDALSKALLALRGSENEIELRPWLYRIVRNTALNELRDRPPSAAELDEVALAGGLSAAAEAERREEMAELMARLRALPEPQRAAIVMRELEGLSHEEIATALGVSGGAARQTIYRARAALRDGLGLLVPLPLLRLLFDHGAEAAGAGGAAAAAGAGAVAGGGGAVLGGFGTGAALKVGVATAVLAGSVGAGVAIQHERGGERGPAQAEASVALPAGGGGAAAIAPSSSGPGSGGLLSPDDRGDGEDEQGEDRGERGDDSNRGEDRGGDDDRGRGRGENDERGENSGRDGRREDGGRGRGGDRDDDFDDSHVRDSDSSGRGRGRSGDEAEESHSGEDRSGSSGSGRSGSSSGSGGDSSGSGSSGSGYDGGEDHSGSGGDSDPAPVVAAPPLPEPTAAEAEDDFDGSGSGSGDSGGGDD